MVALTHQLSNPCCFTKARGTNGKKHRPFDPAGPYLTDPLQCRSKSLAQKHLKKTSGQFRKPTLIGLLFVSHSFICWKVKATSLWGLFSRKDGEQEKLKKHKKGEKSPPWRSLQATTSCKTIIGLIQCPPGHWNAPDVERPRRNGAVSNCTVFFPPLFCNMAAGIRILNFSTRASL